MRVSARDVVLFADRETLVHCRSPGRMVVLPREAEVLRQIALADDHDPDPRNLVEHLGQVLYCTHFFAHDRDQDFALRVERPDIGAGIIFLLRQSPIARRSRGRIASLTRRLEILRRAGPRITAGGGPVARLVHRTDMPPDHAVYPL